MPLLEPWQSWVLFGIGVSGAWVYYSRTDNRRRGRGGAPHVPAPNRRRASQRRNSSTEVGSRMGNSRQRSQPISINEPEASSSAIKTNKNAKVRNRKGGNAKGNQLSQSSAVDPIIPQEVGGSSQEAQDEEVDNREFAKQMAGLKTGSTIAKNDGSKNKTKKQSKQAELPLNSFNALAPAVNGVSSSKDPSNASSTTGADADEDLSPTTSPQVGAAQAATSGDVSDMLEAPTKGPSVLRLTGVEEPKRQSKPQKVAQEAETKKQRHNRRKKEEQKAAREEAERDRRVLLEKQLRTAREADGRPARNGMGSAPATNAWSKHSTNNMTSSASAPNESLLDTFDDSNKSTINGRSQQQDTAAADMRPWHNEVPSEEEQLRILSEMDGNGGWSTVKTGKKKKPYASNDMENQRKMSNASISVSGSTSTSGDSILHPTPSQSQTEDETPRVPVQKEDIDRNIWNHDNIKDHPKYDPDYPHALLGHPGDSDWAVV
ncbi:MAG: hypothetical protein Q9209_006702 [Squamulea sp. 1 TL-2023]